MWLQVTRRCERNSAKAGGTLPGQMVTFGLAMIKFRAASLLRNEFLGRMGPFGRSPSFFISPPPERSST
jgi:hypothetical protein